LLKFYLKLAQGIHFQAGKKFDLSQASDFAWLSKIFLEEVAPKDKLETE
jgi:hypothetical protein